MVRNYVQKSERLTEFSMNLQLAIRAVIKGKSIRAAAEEHGIPRSTLQRHIKSEVNDLSHSASKQSPLSKGFQRVFSDDQEKALYNYIIDMQSSLMGLTSKELRKLAFQYAEKLGLSHHFNQNNQMAGKDWLSKFMQRHNLSHRKAEFTSTARARGFNKKAVQEFYDLLEKVREEHDIQDENIYNVDETGLTVNPKSCSRIIATRGAKQIGGLTAAERGETITAELCMSATGKFMPPLLIFPRVKRNEEFLAEKPPDARAVFHKSGWIQEDIFTDWFKWFIEFSGASKDKPVLLLLDGHATHIKNLNVIDLARANNVTILCFPPHCTHRLQPLDVSFMKPLSHFYTEEVISWQRLGHTVKMTDIFKLFGKAWENACQENTAKNGFKKSGIVPFNRHIFKDSDYAAMDRDTTESEKGLFKNF